MFFWIPASTGMTNKVKGFMTHYTNVVNLMLLYNDLKGVIPAPISIGIISSRNPDLKNWIPDQVRNDKACKIISEKRR
jgi:hypothetical protein